jgi:cell division protein FtsN
MGRTLKILAYAVILFLTYLVITAALKSCKNDSKDVASAQVENTDAQDETYDDDDFFEEGSETSSESDDFFGPEGEEKIDYDEIDKALDESTSSKQDTYEEPDYTTTTKPSTPPRSSTSSSSAGQYMVIAGSYIINTNAENMVLKLKKMGYANSEIVVFDQSQYYTVVAGRSDSYDGAMTVSGKLKSRGIDSYVHKKQ